MIHITPWRPTRAALICVLLLVGTLPLAPSAALAQSATPAASPPSAAYSCDALDTAPPPAAPAVAEGDASPAAEIHDHGTDDASVDIDLAYIDMMIPHHAAIIALAQAALPRLTDDRLIAIAEDVAATQEAEIAELQGYREAWFGSPAPEPLDDAEAMALMPDAAMAAPMDDMQAQMDPTVQLARFCAAPDPDLAFIDLVIPHHASAIDASRAALDGSQRPEIIDLAQRVIDAQQTEIDMLLEIRLDLYGSATPEAVAGS